MVRVTLAAIVAGVEITNTHRGSPSRRVLMLVTRLSQNCNMTDSQNWLTGAHHMTYGQAPRTRRWSMQPRAA
jgi:hypothetical protein